MVSTAAVQTQRSQGNASFDCNICLEAANDPVVTVCGHLFCWPCLYKWLQCATCRDCPVCKAILHEKMVIPLYGRGNLEPVHGRTKAFPDIPSRPVGRRPETVRSAQQYSSPGFFGYRASPRSSASTARFNNFTMTVRFGFFPLLTLQFNDFSNSSTLPGSGNGAAFGGHGRFSASANRQQEKAVMSKLSFLAILAILCLFFLL
ncbi:hypothetical protein O6H91_03G129900 [Diphasiastrum complanatum]|uniref:Uncharacterized protein n=2 Tax=Diphasiastrum complanatum TaxID=34168 RepID=A0ACC2BC90_DIPCM|nr:hypothetical protein O6H91_16G052300 [Diphasiastrum complanatum]KAJ7563907.1 hypothetical protein O6H91_03G129900 [Diphasiastrum complanatum]